MPTIANANAATKQEIREVVNGANYVLVANATGVAATDTAAINAAITAAGTKGIVQFPANQTYLTWGGHELLSGQKVHGNGSTIKRANQSQSLLTTATITTTPTATVNVADGTQFTIGQYITVTVDDGVAGAYNTTANYCQPVKITNIVANALTVSPSIAAQNSGGAFKALSVANGAVVCSAGRQMLAGYSSGSKLAWASLPSGILIDGLLFDGNKANNLIGRWWDVSEAVLIGCHNFVMQKCAFKDSMSDDIIYSGNNVKVLNCISENSSGNFSHPGSWTGTNEGVNVGTCSGCQVNDCNGDTAIGHSDGAFIFSSNVHGFAYDGNVVDGGNRYGFGAGFNATDSECAFTGNIAMNCLNGAFQFAAGTNVVFTGNVCMDCGQDTSAAAIQVSELGGTLLEATITGNVFDNSPMFIRGSATGMTISGNAFSSNQSKTTNWILGMIFFSTSTCRVLIFGNSFRFYGTAASTNVRCIYAVSSEEMQIIGNRFEGGQHGINMGNCSNYQISANTFVNNWAAALLANDSALTTGKAIFGNTIIAKAGVDTTWYGISIITNATAGTDYYEVSYNFIRSALSSNTQYGIWLSVASTNYRVRMIGNKVIVGAHGTAYTFNASAAVDATCHLIGNSVSKAAAANMAAATLVYPAVDSNMVITTA